MFTPGTFLAYRDWTGYNWTLSGWGAGRQGPLLMPGPKGLLGAPTDLIFVEGARQQGATYTGKSVSKLTLDFEVDLHAPTVHEFRRLNERWLRAHQYDKPGHLITWSPGGPWMYLRVRKSAVPIPKFQKDSSLIRAQQYAMQWIAEKPYWQAPDEPASWFDKGGASSGKLTLRNRGDIEGWPRFIITGPGTPSIQDGHGGPMVPLPKLAAGEIWRVDTDNRKPTIVSNLRTNPWAYMKGRRFRNPIPAGEAATLTVTMTGGDRTNSVLALLTPRYDWIR